MHKVNNACDTPTERKTSSHAVIIHSSWLPTKTTLVFDTYWKFAAKRQAIFFKRVNEIEEHLTDDEILNTYKFTNAYRASDRVSQYLIRHVIYEGNQSPEELFFRILLFKTFNKIETWKLLTARLGEITFVGYDFNKCDEVLTESLQRRNSIYSAAYIMPSGSKSFGQSYKHRSHLKLIEMMMADSVPRRICDAKSMHQVFDLLRSYPMIGDFLAYQYAIDLNYRERHGCQGYTFYFLIFKLKRKSGDTILNCRRRPIGRLRRFKGQGGRS